MQAPQNIQVNILNSTDVQVSFDSPEQQMIPGVNLGYKVSFSYILSLIFRLNFGKIVLFLFELFVFCPNLSEFMFKLEIWKNLVITS